MQRMQQRPYLLYVMKPYFDFIVSVLTFLTLASGLYFGIRRFGLKRERFCFLNLTVDTKVIKNIGKVKLSSIVVTLENKGETRIDTRRRRRDDGFLYNDDWDQCMHAGTLKIRPIAAQEEPLLLDWYSLKPMTAKVSRVVAEGVCAVEESLDQINYLSEFQDPATNYNEVDFWLEPKESYKFEVPIWLPPGLYWAKAYFLGRREKHREDEYWSHATIFEVRDDSTND